MIRALLGGSFDPVHTGHVAMVAHLFEHGLADHVTVVPNWRSPWREPTGASPLDRLAMCRLAFAGRAGVTIDDREVVAGRPVYTVETLTALCAEYPADRWRLVVGADHLATFNAWREPERILALAELVVLERAGVAELPPGLCGLGLPTERIVLAPTFDHPVSASAVRAMLAAGAGASAPVPAAVAAYIEAHRLYRVA